MQSEMVRFIQSNLLRDTRDSVGPDDSLIDRGLLDSMGLMRIMQFVETQYSVRIPDGWITPDNFQSVRAIEAMVARLQAAPRQV